MSRKRWSQPLTWGMIIAILNPLGVSYIALIGVVIGNTLTFVWCAMLAWAIYFYAISPQEYIYVVKSYIISDTYR